MRIEPVSCKFRAGTVNTYSIGPTPLDAQAPPGDAHTVGALEDRVRRARALVGKKRGPDAQLQPARAKSLSCGRLVLHDWRPRGSFSLRRPRPLLPTRPARERARLEDQYKGPSNARGQDAARARPCASARRQACRVPRQQATKPEVRPRPHPRRQGFHSRGPCAVRTLPRWALARPRRRRQERPTAKNCVSLCAPVAGALPVDLRSSSLSSPLAARYGPKPRPTTNGRDSLKALCFARLRAVSLSLSPMRSLITIKHLGRCKARSNDSQLRRREVMGRRAIETVRAGPTRSAWCDRSSASTCALPPISLNEEIVFKEEFC